MIVFNYCDKHIIVGTLHKTVLTLSYFELLQFSITNHCNFFETFYCTNDKKEQTIWYMCGME